MLRGADLAGAHLEGADLTFVRLEGAFCRENDAGLKQACLEGAKSWDAYFERIGPSRRRRLHRGIIEGANLLGRM